MERPKKSKVSSDSRSNRAAKQMEEDPSQIQDSAERKKVQNRIAQRIYRERMKKRMEALESFREQSTASLINATLPHTSPAALATTKELDRQYFPPMSSPPLPTANLPQSYSSRKRGYSANSSTPASPSVREASLTPSLQSQSDPMAAMVNLSVDPTLLFKNNEHGPSNMWDLSQAFNFDLEDVTDINRPAEVDLPMTPASTSSDLKKELTQDPISLPNTPIPTNHAPKTPSRNHKTALHIAASGGKTSTVQLLLSLSPDTLAQDSHGHTALHLAILSAQHSIITELLKAPQVHQLLEVRDREGSTALHLAAARGDERAVGALLGAGADVEGKDGRGRTALMVAAEEGADGIVGVLWKWGADVNARMEM